MGKLRQKDLLTSASDMKKLQRLPGLCLLVHNSKFLGQISQLGLGDYPGLWLLRGSDGPGIAIGCHSQRKDLYELYSRLQKCPWKSKDAPETFGNKEKYVWITQVKFDTYSHLWKSVDK